VRQPRREAAQRLEEEAAARRAAEGLLHEEVAARRAAEGLLHEEVAARRAAEEEIERLRDICTRFQYTGIETRISITTSTPTSDVSATIAEGAAIVTEEQHDAGTTATTLHGASEESERESAQEEAVVDNRKGPRRNRRDRRKAERQTQRRERNSPMPSARSVLASIENIPAALLNEVSPEMAVVLLKTIPASKWEFVVSIYSIFFF